MNNSTEQFSDEYYDLVDRFVATGAFGGRPEAADAVRRLRPDLVPRASKPTQQTQRPAGAAGRGETAEQELERLAKQYQREHPGMTFAESYVAILRANADLYVRYLRELRDKVAAEAEARRG